MDCTQENAVQLDENQGTGDSMENGDVPTIPPLFSKDSEENAIHHKDDRIIRRAKRSSKEGLKSVDESHAVAANGGVTNVIRGSGCAGPRSRHRHGRGRPGQPKKGGAGGKGVWGKLGSELDESGVCQDIKDPNYDSDSQEDFKLVSVLPVLDDNQLDQAVKPILQEYLEHGNTCEVEDLLSGLNIGPNGHKVMKMAITLGMDRHNPQRELMSQLISDLYNRCLSTDDISKGFSELLASINDLRLDTPDAHNLLGQFIARCIADDCLPPKFISGYKGKVENEYVRDALEKARVLITMSQGMAHLDNIWGVGGGNRPVKYLTNKMVALLKEYISSGDKNEAMKCLLELEVPHFHHELVYQACDIAIEDSSERVCDAMVALLQFLTSSGVITVDQFEKGMKRLFDDLYDISVDVPNAFHLMDLLANKLHTARVLSDQLLKELPARGRKRFVSEGDGGLVKPAAF